MRISTTLLLLVQGLACIPTAGQNLRLPISNYTNKVYGRGYEATNYCILTDQRNLVYAGNANGILEYDGSEWRFIPVSQGAYVTSMDLAPSGIVYVGSQQEFGYLGPGRAGELQYHSLSDRLAEEDRFFSTVWATHAAKDFVAYQAEECLFVFRKDSLLAVYPETSFHTSFLVGESLYVRERGSGLKVLSGNAFEAVKGGEIFSDLGIFGMFPLDESGSVLIATMEKGFYRYVPGQGMERMPTDRDDFLIRAGILGGIPLADGNIALHSLHQGVIVCNRQGEIMAVFNKHGGLNENDVKDLWQDMHRNIWCALNNGIGKIDYASPLSYYDEDAGLEGSVHAVIRHGDRLFVGTTSGLYAGNRKGGFQLSMVFSPFAGIRDQVWDLKSVGNELVAGTSNGLYVIRGESVRKVSGMNAFAMHYLEKEKLMLVGGSGGLAAFDPARNWRTVEGFGEIQVDVKAIAQNRRTRYDATEIWLGTSLQGTVKLLVNPDLSYEFSQYYGPGDGLPEDWVLPFEHHDSIVFGTRSGIMNFIDEQLIRAALPDSLKDIPEYNRGYFEMSYLYERPVNLPLSFVTEAYAKTWAVIDNQIVLIDQESRGDWIEKPFRSIDLGEINFIYPDDGNTTWIAAGDGLARFELSSMDKPTGDLHAAIRAVYVSGDSLIFDGMQYFPEHFSDCDPGILFRQQEDMVPELTHAFNDLTFFYTAPFYDYENKNQFSWMLKDGREGWSNWSNRRVTGFTNLHEGEYTFLVRMKSIYGDISEAAAYRFVIRPPWFRTVPAYIGYLILLSILIYMAVRLGQMRLRKKNERLEAIVQQRTEEIRLQNIKLAAQKKEITDSIYYAERIQRAILPQTERIADQVEGYFILFKPKDIVSGDFYWLAENGRKIIVTAVDCTGHGVPGAFMSMLGVSFLNKIILENNNLQADRILNELRENVVGSLKQTGKEGEARDGMDMALVVIDLQRMTMEFAGANNPLYMIREDELTETKADRMPIGYYIDADDFSSHNIQLKKGDTLYLFSDGYADQFGGPAGKKFKYKSFKELLYENRNKSMEDVKRVLDDTIEAWKAPGGEEGDAYEQVDDILVIGLRI